MTGELAVGIDAGGTTTRCLAVDATGAVVGTASAGGANANSSVAVEQAFGDVLTAVLGAAAGDCRVGALVLGVAGAGPAGRTRATGQLQGAARRTGIEVGRLLVVSDAETAFAAGSVEPDGTVLVAGTGALAARLRDFAVVLRRDGLGYLLGDEGSAFRIGSAGLRAVLAAVEGRGPETSLRMPMLDHARGALADRADASDLDDVQAVVAAVYSHPPAWLGSFAPFVDAAASGGDAVATGIVRGAVEALVATARQVRDPDQPAAPLVITGGVATGRGLLGESLRATLKRELGVAPRVVTDPAVGAAALALRALPGADPAAADAFVLRNGPGHGV